jgi:hypothetical protein
LSAEKFDKMVEKAKEIIIKDWKLDWDNVVLVSGGASWADHVAVKLFMQEDVELTLELPCRWDEKNHKFIDIGTKDWRTNPGNYSNYLHSKFSKKIKSNSLEEIHQSIKNGANIIFSDGFFARNNKVSESDRMIAFGFNSKDMEPRDGGTAFTWKISKSNNKKYVCIDLL